MSKYFAQLEVEELGSQLSKKIDDYYSHIDSNGILSLWRNSYQKYYRSRFTDGQMIAGGDQDEYTILYVNQYRNFVQNLLTLTTATRPYFEPQATNSDYSSQAITILAKGLLDYYTKEKRMDRNLTLGAEMAILFGEGFGAIEWDFYSGDDYIPDEKGDLLKEGDLEYSYYSPIDVIRDVHARKPEKLDWYILRKFVNKYELAERYPEKAEQIIATEYTPDRDYYSDIEIARSRIKGSEFIPLYTFMHGKTQAVVDGRITHFLKDGEILNDAPLPYKRVPVFRVATSNTEESIFGYSVAFDLLPIQEMIDVLISTVATNQKNHGVIDIISPRGSNLSIPKQSPGMNFLEYDIVQQGVKPEVLDKLKTAPEIFNFTKDLIGFMQEITGVNSAVRGNPPPGLTAGVSLALLSSNAIQFSRRLEESYAQFAEDHGTTTIQILQEYAQTPRVVQIVGKYDSVLTKEFKAEDLSQISRVTVSMGNPLMRTTAGRMNMAENFLKNGWITNPDQLVQVLETGRYEPAFEQKRMENMTIRQENERLMEGTLDSSGKISGVIAILTDQHLQHINEHKGVLASPAARENPEIVKAVLEHIQEHMDILTNMELMPFLNALGQQSMAPMMPPPQAPPPQGVNDPSAQPAGSPLQAGGEGVPDVRALNTLSNPVTGEPLDVQPNGLI